MVSNDRLSMNWFIHDVKIEIIIIINQLIDNIIIEFISKIHPAKNQGKVTKNQLIMKACSAVFVS
jgi:hypothetical protein